MMMNKVNKQPIRSVFHDCGYLYVSTIEPDIDEPITIRLRGEKGNITKAYVEISHEGTQWTSYELQLEGDDSTGYYEYFVGTIPGQKEMFKYRFRVGNDEPENEVYYSRTRIGKDAPTFDETCMQPDDCWTMIPGFHTPDWAKGIIWYSVMPDAYYNGDLTNDKPVSGKNFSNSWNMAQHTLSYKYGGDLKGIEKKLDYIKSLGCEAVFMNPIFCSHQNAGYGPQYYKQIEGSVGNKQALIDLSKAIHDRDMRYMIDVVFAFVTPSHYWYNRDKIYPNKGAAQEWDSPYHEFFYFTGEEGDTSKYLSSWSGLRLNMASEKLRDLLYRDKDSYLQYYCREPFFVDGVRFDCGGELGGEFSDGTKLVDSDVLGEIRPILRDINPEILLLSEYSMYYSVDKGVWDSRWNLEFVKYGLQYMRGEFPESRMYERIVNEINNVPRAFGHCIYNSMADHDRPRVTGVQPYAFRAFQLIHMTQIGSPCIFYGDENRIERETYNFYAMEWNEANWDYAVLNDTKALTELRKTYSALRTGIIQYLSVDDDERILAYARKDAEGTVITVASRNEAAKEFTIHVRELGEVDGTVFTDWFSGKQYEARNGYIEVLLPAGGTVFVKGSKSASHKGGFAIAGLHVDTSSVTMPKEHAFAIKEQGIFVHTDVFNTCEISALCRMQNGKGMLKIAAETEKDSAWIGAEVSEDTVAIYVQTTGNQEPCKVAETFIEENTYVKIVRDAKNYYSVYTTRTLGWKWNEVARGIHVDIPNHAKAGMLSMYGEAVFENVRVKYDKNSILFDDFRDGHSAMFDFDETMKIAYTTEGMKMQDAEIVTNANDEDWTFRTEVLLEDSQPNDYAGIVCRQDKEIAVVTGRMNNEGVPVFFLGKYSAGKLVVVHIVEDFHPEQKAIVQLQRIGTAYSAVYSYDGSDFSMIGRNIIANMCAERVGLVVQGNAMGKFSYACFGNSISDGVSCNTPHTPMEINVDFSKMHNTLTQETYEIISGKWSYGEEGFLQSSKELAQLSVSSKIYEEFKVEATYSIEEGSGFVGFEFGKRAHDSDLGDGVLFCLDSNRRVRLVQQGEVLAEAIVPQEFGNAVKLSVEYRHDVFVVYAGQEAMPIIVLREMDAIQGYISYVTKGVIARINNCMTASNDATIYCNSGYEPLQFTPTGVTKSWVSTHGFFNPFGVGVTDFVATAKFNVKQFANSWNKPYVGFYICSPEAKFVEKKFITIGFQADNQLFVKNGESNIAVAQMSGSTNCRELMVVKKGQDIQVFAEHGKEALIKCKIPTFDGGPITLCASMASVQFESMTLVNLNGTDKPENAKNYRTYMEN